MPQTVTINKHPEHGFVHGGPEQSLAAAIALQHGVWLAPIDWVAVVSQSASDVLCLEPAAAAQVAFQGGSLAPRQRWRRSSRPGRFRGPT